MARGATSASRLGGTTTTYKTKKRSPAFQRSATIHKSPAIKPLPEATRRNAGLKAVEDDVGSSDEDDDENDGTDGSKEAADHGHTEDEFDPQLKAMVARSGLRFQRANLLPHQSTPNTSRTLVNRSKHHLPPVATSTPKIDSNSKKRKVVVLEADSDDDDREEKESSSTSSSNEDDDNDNSSDGFNGVVLANQRISKKIKTTTASTSNRGKENALIVGKGGVIKANEYNRKFGQGKNKDRSKDHVTTTSHLSKPRMKRTEHVRPEASSYHQHAAKSLHVQTSDSEQTDSTGDHNAFGFQTALLGAVPAKAHYHEARYEIEGFGRSGGEEDESSEEVVEQVHKEYGQAREEVKLDVKEMYVSAKVILRKSKNSLTPCGALSNSKAAFRGVGASMKAQRSKISTQLLEEIQPMQQSTEKIFKVMAGPYTEKMLDQQSLLQKSLGECRQFFSAAKKGLAETEESLRGIAIVIQQKKAVDLQEKAAKLEERKQVVFERALKQITDLDKKQAKEERAILAEMEQVRDRAKAKAEKLLDPAVLNAKFAKQVSRVTSISGTNGESIMA
ncbi:hypothetical protein QFC22_001131 [Naganishia vaughanmartiniae]|uniref:Uncharacterized protein n=1 Tax=Naganishia vaughanmartiniae TaxID=1424756 RepID=A0ACC2XMT9_9TREE|nr:hypothetical protein QFC22_001131 [Naganishia vaughanmartiniae]